MLHLITASISPRLRYTTALVFKQLMGVECRCILLNEYDPHLHPVAINYTQSILSGTFSVPNAGLLKGNSITEIDIRVSYQEIPYLFRFSASAISYDLEYDIFSAVFYLVSEYEKYVSFYSDQYDRYHQKQYPSNQYQLDRYPLVHLYANELHSKLQTYFPALSFDAKAGKPTYEITFDIDFPWKYLHKGLLASLGGLAKDLLEANGARMRERLFSWVSRKDPNDTYKRIFEMCPPAHTRFFFLIGRHAPQDSRFSLQNRAYQQLIRRIAREGFGVGIHPSFTTYRNPARLLEETQQLGTLLSLPISHSRQHFLRYRLPDTYHSLLEAGITADYTPCLFETGGFPNGMAAPYYWYDLSREESTTLRLHPTQLMDRSLLNYMQLGPEASSERIRYLIATTRQVNGTFTLLLHNDCFSESAEWKGWSGVFEKTIKALVDAT